MADPQQYSDLPPGASLTPQVRKSTGASNAQYSDLPPGASLTPSNTNNTLGMSNPKFPGSTINVPRERAGGYVKNGWQVGPASQSDMSKNIKAADASLATPSEGAGSSFVHALGLPTSQDEAKQMPGAMAKRMLKFNPLNPLAVLGPSEEDQQAHALKTSQTLLQSARDLRRGNFGDAGLGAVRGGGQFAAGLLGGVGGLNLEKAGEQFGEGNWQGGVGTTAGTLLPLAVGKVISSKAAPPLAETHGTRPWTSAPDVLTKALNRIDTPNPRAASVDALFKATNPSPVDAPGFKANAAADHDLHIAYAKKAGIDNAALNAKTPGQALEIAAQGPEGARQNLPYFKNVLRPNQDVVAPTTGFNGYGGATSGYNQATIRQLSNRLTEINGELYPKFQKGGAGSAASGAALNAERAGALKAEAAGISNTINQTLSRVTGIPVEQLATQRAQYGRLGDVSDTMRSRAFEMQQKENAAGNRQANLADAVPDMQHPLGGIQRLAAKIPLQRDPIFQGLRKMYGYEPSQAAPLQGTPPLASAPRIKDGFYDYIQPTTSGKTGIQSPLPPEVAKMLQMAEEQPPLTGKPLTVRAGRAQAARGAADSASRGASAQPPNMPQREPLAPSVAGPTTGALPLPNQGGVLNRPPLQLPVGPQPNLLPAQGTPISLPPSTLTGPPPSFLQQYIESGARPAPRTELPITSAPTRQGAMRTAPLASNTSAVVEHSPVPSVAQTLGVVEVIHPDGTPGTIPAVKLQEYLDKGYRLKTALGRGIGGGQ